MDLFFTKTVAIDIQQDDAFGYFVISSVHRHLSGDWGEVGNYDKWKNDTCPREALSVYTSPDGRKIWIKQDIDILTVLYPSEY